MSKSQKGAQFERDICNYTSRWFTNGDRDDIFWRTSGSGARATTRAKKQKLTAYEYGDMSFTDPIGKPFIDYFLVEIKRGYTKNIDLLQFVDKLSSSKAPILLQWWKKAEKERKFGKRKNTLIIFKRDRHEICCMISGLLFSKCKNRYNKPLFNFINVTLGTKNFIVMRYYDFLGWIDNNIVLFEK